MNEIRMNYPDLDIFDRGIPVKHNKVHFTENDYFRKCNLLSELKTDFEKEIARKNLGITGDISDELLEALIEKYFNEHPITDIKADDVIFEKNTSSGPEMNNVDEALEAIIAKLWELKASIKIQLATGTATQCEVGLTVNATLTITPLNNNTNCTYVYTNSLSDNLTETDKTLLKLNKAITKDINYTADRSTKSAYITLTGIDADGKEYTAKSDTVSITGYWKYKVFPDNQEVNLNSLTSVNAYDLCTNTSLTYTVNFNGVKYFLLPGQISSASGGGMDYSKTFSLVGSKSLSLNGVNHTYYLYKTTNQSISSTVVTVNFNNK